MAGAGMDDAAFRQALGAYEGLRNALVAQTNQDAAHRQAVAMIDGMFSGFADAHAAYEDEQLNRVKHIRIGHQIRKDGGRPDWYVSARELHGEWPSYRERLLASGMPEKAVESIHQSTDRILRQCANPRSVGDRRKGLVIGYVQSGKTANFTGLVAKAVDEGYRIIIILAGMYTNLRVQTQMRLEKDLEIGSGRERTGIAWQPYTGAEADIGKNPSVAPFSSTQNVAVMVVKKHEMRLANVTKLLRSIPDETLAHRPVLVIDDESDQATPNTLGDKDLVSTINQRIRDLWAAVPTGTYVAYTATPFANVFINPADENDLYPDDFISVLPKPEGYMGSELFFDVDQTSDGDVDEMIHQLAHEVPEEEALVFTPKPRKLDDFAPAMTDSLESAIRWFILATAIRELRSSKQQDSSMLVHTSQLVHVHQQTKEVIADFVSSLALDVEHEEATFRETFEKERDGAAALRGQLSMPEWDVLWPVAKKVLSRVVVKIDNGKSDDRLIYHPGSPQAVIAVGGGTLSRGLTLEGLVVSYFLRSSNTYDTLLQMGRWFGFRPGYADLVRVWMGPGLLEEYRHLATVEKQLRGEVVEMEKENRIPRDFAIKVQSHPGRLEITSKGKMDAAKLVRAGLGGTRRQTIYLDRSPEGRAAASDAASALVRRAAELDPRPLVRRAHQNRPNPTQMYRGLSNSEIVEFLRGFWVSPTDRWLQSDGMSGWLARHGAGKSWNLVLVSGSSNTTHTFSSGIQVRTSRRAPLMDHLWTQNRISDPLPSHVDLVNIRALMAGDDYMLDLRLLADNGMLDEEDIKLLEGTDKRSASAVKAARALIRPDEGTILLYAVDGDSQPDKKGSTTRTGMGAEGTMFGLGVVFPHAEAEDPGEYWAVDLPEQEAEEELGPRDDEADYERGEAE